MRLKLSLATHTRLARLIQRLRSDHRGVAAVEFAMIVPIMFLLFVGSIEFSQALTVDRRVTQAASSSADLIARAPSTGLTTSDIDGLLKIVNQLMEPYDLAPLTIEINHVKRKATGNYVSSWSRKYVNGVYSNPTGLCTAFTSMPSGTALIASDNAEGLVVATAQYNYSPLIFHYFITSAFVMQETFYLKPRNARCISRDGTSCTTSCP